MTDALGHAFYLSLIAGQLAVTRKRRWGFAARVLGSLGWLCIGVELGMSSIVLWSAIFAAVDLYGWIRWRSRP